MSTGREGYVPGGYKLSDAWGFEHGYVSLEYRNRKGKVYLRVVQPHQKGYRHAAYLLRKWRREH